MRYRKVICASLWWLSLTLAQSYEGATTSISLSWHTEVALPTVAFYSEACAGEAASLVPEAELEWVQRMYESEAADETRPSMTFTDACYVFLALSQSEAHRTIAQVINAMRSAEIESYYQSYYEEIYTFLEVIEAPNSFFANFVQAETYDKEMLMNPYAFGMVVFEYSPDREELRLHKHHYYSEPAY
jgi:hypothetical protein